MVVKQEEYIEKKKRKKCAKEILHIFLIFQDNQTSFQAKNQTKKKKEKNESKNN